MTVHTRTALSRLVWSLSLTSLLVPSALADDWTNSGGNAQRNGRTTEIGPDAASPDELLWSGARSSIIAWQPVIEGNRIFVVRQTGFPPGGEPGGSPIVAIDLDTGTELWPAPVNIPYNSGDWTTWIAGVKNGRLYASRSGNGASVSAKLHCLDAATGATIWQSVDLIDAGVYDGAVFADNGDPIIASFRTIKRIRATDGTTAWTASRVGSVSGNCGAALSGDAVYVADAAPGGTVIKRFDLATGDFRYASPVMTGFTVQNSPMVGPDGTVYLSRTQNNTAADFFYAFEDTGAALVEKWHVPAAWSTGGEFAIGPDGSVYMMAPGPAPGDPAEIHRLDPEGGMMLNTSGPIPADFLTPRMAVDAQGRLFFSNGAFSNGRLYSFNADLTLRWSEAVPNANIGSPTIGNNGTLLIAGSGTNVKAYRTDRTPPTCPADWDHNSVLEPADVAAFVGTWFSSLTQGNLAGDFDGNTEIQPADVAAFVSAWFSAVTVGC